MDAEIVVELFSRIKVLERDIALLGQRVSDIQKIVDAKNGSESSPEISAPHGIMSSKPLIERKRDTTRYAFEGAVYSKKGLVYAVVKRYVTDHPEISCTDLRLVFDKSLQGSLGVVEKIDIAKQRGDAEYQVRFFTNEDEILHLRDGDMVVCTQWGIMNIPRFLAVAKRLGYQITSIS